MAWWNTARRTPARFRTSRASWTSDTAISRAPSRRNPGLSSHSSSWSEASYDTQKDRTGQPRDEADEAAGEGEDSQARSPDAERERGRPRPAHAEGRVR